MLSHQLIVFYAYLVTSLKSNLQYSFKFILNSLSDTVYPIILASVWLIVSENSSLSLSGQQVATYFILLIFVSKITSDNAIETVSDAIYYGDFSNYLIRPRNYLIEIVGAKASNSFIQLLILTPFVSLFIYFESQFFNIFISLVALIYGVAISFLIGNTFALLILHIRQLYSLKIIYQNICMILSGALIPLMFLPWGLFEILKFLPFRYIISFPIEILLGILSNEDIFNGFLVATLWLTILITLYKVTFRLSIHKYEAEGI